MNSKKIMKLAIVLVLIIATFCSVLATVHYYHSGELLTYNDARSRLDIARRVTDSKTPGIVQIGTVWLPLQQLLIFPFAANYSLWHSGLAGSIVSMLAFIVAAVYIFRLTALLTKQAWLGVAGSLLFILNKNILYLQSTAMTEILLIATLVFGLFYFARWLYEKRDIDLVLAALGLFLGTLVRYEAWTVLIGCLLVVLYETRHYEQNKVKANGQAVLFATLGAFGIFLWLLWNGLFFGRPLYFITAQHGQYSLGGSNLRYDHASRHHLFSTINTMWRAIGYNIGFITLLLVVIGLVFIFMKRFQQRRFIVYLVILLSLPVLLNVLTLFTGSTDIRATHFNTAMNLRYGITAILLVAVALPLAISKLPKISQPVAAAVLLLLLIPVQPAALSSATTGGRTLSAKTKAFSSEVQRTYTGGSILASTYAFDPVMSAAGIPLKNYVYEGNYRIWQKTLKNPQNSVQYILISRNVPHDPVYDAYKANVHSYRQYFSIVYSKNGYSLLVAKSVLIQKDAAPIIIDTTQPTIIPTPIAKPALAPTPVATQPETLTSEVQNGDSQSSIVNQLIINYDPSLTPAQRAFVINHEVSLLGNQDIINPGDMVTVQQKDLTNLIEQSKQLSASEVSAWQAYGATL